MRVLLRFAIGLVALAICAVAAFLVPQHVQVRGIEPPLPSDSELRSLLAAPDRPVGMRYVVTSSQTVDGLLISHLVFLVEWADGRLFMIDAAMDRVAAVEFADLIGHVIDAGEVEVRGSVTELMGSDIERVMGVGFTHLHIDHVQGLIEFCKARGARVDVFQTTSQATLHNFHTREGADILAESCLDQRQLGAGTLHTVDGFPGVGVVALGGHTPGSTLFAVASRDRLWLLSGDITNAKRDLIENRGKGFLYSYVLAPENTHRTEALRRWLAELDANDDMTVIVSHDLASIEASGMRSLTR